MDPKKRIAELQKMRENGGLTESELKELGDLQEQVKKTDEKMVVTETQLKELVGNSVKEATKELNDEIQKLKTADPKKIHGDAHYRSPDRGKKPEIASDRRELVGAGLRDFMLNRQSKALTEITDAAGGILIPTEFRDMIIWYAGIYGIARRLCQYSPMISKEQQIDAVATEPIGYWVGEADDTTESDVEFETDLKLIANECAVLVTASKKFIADLKDARGIDIFSLLSKLFGKAVAKQEDDQMINGVGTPFTGFLAHASIPAVVMAATKTSFNDIGYGDLIDVTRTVPVEFKRGGRPVWIMHQDIIAIVEKLVDSQARPIFLRGTKDGEDDRLLGFPIEYSDLSPAIGDDAVSTKMLTFGDPIYSSFGDRETLDIERHVSGTIGGVNLITKRRVGIQGTEQVAFVIVKPTAFSTLKTAAA